MLGDFDNDEHDNLATVSTQGVRLFHNDGDGNFADVTEKVGLPAAIEGAVGVTFVDVDHDGDLDLIVTGAATRLFRNNGNGTFTDVTSRARLRARRTPRGDHRQRSEQRSRHRPGADRREARRADQPARRRVQAAGRLQRGRADGYPRRRRARLRQGRLDGSGVHVGRRPGADALAKRERAQSFERVDLPPSTHRGTAPASPAVDYDNDGWLDLVAAGTRRRTAACCRSCATCRVDFEDASSTRRQTSACRAEATARSSSPAISTATTTPTSSSPTPRGPPVLLRNDGGNANHAIRLALTGLNDNRSGVGTKVEVQAGAIWQKFETVAASGFLGQSSPEILAGIGQATRGRRRPSALADRRRAGRSAARRRTSGTRSPRSIAAAARARSSSRGTARRSSSSPTAIGPAVIGHWVAPGSTHTPDIDEFVKVDGSKRPREDGRAVVPLHRADGGNQLPRSGAAVRRRPSRRLRGLPERVLRRRRRRCPRTRTIVAAARDCRCGAWDDRGHDLHAGASRRRSPVRRTRSQDAPFKGFATLHALELDLGTLAAGAPLRLLMRGFTDYFTATSMFAAIQADVSAIAPYLEAQRRRRLVDARQRRHRLPGRPAAHDDRGSHRQAARRHDGAFASGPT